MPRGVDYVGAVRDNTVTEIRYTVLNAKYGRSLARVDELGGLLKPDKS